jgi:hypothetical protein
MLSREQARKKFAHLAMPTIRMTDIKLMDETGTVWLYLSHEHKYTPQIGFFTIFWIIIGPQDRN